MKLEEIAIYLQSKGHGEIGVSIFANDFNVDCKRGLLLRPRLIGVSIDHYLPGFLKFDFQIVSRARNYETAYGLCLDAAKELTLDRVEMGSWHVHYMRPAHIPVPYPRSQGDIVEANVDISACLVDPEWA